MESILGFGLRVNCVASNTFPGGFDITAFADDSDPVDLPEITITDSAMGLNGDLVTWTVANPIESSISVIPGSSDDRNLQVLFEANRAALGKTVSSDEITLTGVYPDETTVTLSGGVIESGMPENSVASAGRLKSKIYKFRFQNLDRS